MPNKNEIEVVKKFYAALNQNDVPAALECLDPQIERVEFEGTPSAGRFRGLSEMSAHISQGRSTWAEGSCNPERFISEGDKVVVLVHVHVRLKNKTEWIDGRVADAFTLKNGKIIEFRSFMKAEEAFKWAGVKG
ncbi:MAG: nuclear transport factor 2 family protein [Bdellovibrionales bacterium]|nr:nuclear transport factor 2 family protein [Bdellovibrionales bacterium]